uniref:UBA domain-containing protein n=1 Tax=Heterosigma akashiwo TaxID=2829 RepID=A0A7S3UR21_HETAK
MAESLKYNSKVDSRRMPPTWMVGSSPPQQDHINADWQPHSSKQLKKGDVLLDQAHDVQKDRGSAGLPTPPELQQGKGGQQPPPTKEGRADPAAVEQMAQLGFVREWAALALARCSGQVEEAVDFCLANEATMGVLLAEKEEIDSRSSSGTLAGVPSHRHPPSSLLLLCEGGKEEEAETEEPA